MKKAQIVGQIFIYIVALVVVSLVLLFGYRAITGISSDVDKIELVRFENDLRSAVNKIAGEYESVVRYSAKNRLEIPGSYTEVCFSQDQVTDTDARNRAMEKPYIYDIVIDNGAKDNVFLYSQSDTRSFYIEKLQAGVAGGFFCVPVRQGTIDITLKGMGRYAEVYNSTS